MCIYIDRARQMHRREIEDREKGKKKWQNVKHLVNLSEECTEFCVLFFQISVSLKLFRNKLCTQT